MNSRESGKETERKAYAAKAHAKTHACTTCSFCGFVLSIYPTLKGMTTRDGATFREHLKSEHGLKQDILP